MSATLTTSGKHRKRCEISMCRNSAIYRIGHPTHFNTGILICEDCLSSLMDSIANDEELTIKMLKHFDGSEDTELMEAPGVVKGDDCEECKYYQSREDFGYQKIREEFLTAMANNDYKINKTHMESLIKGYCEKNDLPYEVNAEDTKATLFEKLKGMI